VVGEKIRIKEGREMGKRRGREGRKRKKTREEEIHTHRSRPPIDSERCLTEKSGVKCPRPS